MRSIPRGTTYSVPPGKLPLTADMLLAPFPSSGINEVLIVIMIIIRAFLYNSLLIGQPLLYVGQAVVFIESYLTDAVCSFVF